MKLVLFQLPLQGHDFFFSHENIPLAGGYLKAVAAQQGIDVDLLPQHLMSYGSDQSILHFLWSTRPDIVGMSCYVWNIERSLFLAKKIKEWLPCSIIILGGPEITPENQFLLQHKCFDIGIVGEGESLWEQLLLSLPQVPDAPGLLLTGKDETWFFRGGASLPCDLGRWPSPYLSGFLDSHVKEVWWLETVRGCVHQCAYCYYHKQFRKLRTFPLERIIAEVRRAREQGIKEMVFLDPCFSRHPNLRGLLEALAAINGDHCLRFSAECNVEDIDRSIAKMLGQTGFRQMEVGLQSIKGSTLRRVHRHFHSEGFLKGVRSLQDHGIEVMVDIIAGLPGDSLQDICRSLDWVINHEAYDVLMLYPLCLLPSTELRKQAQKLGLSAMPHPPYLVTRGPGLSAADINHAFHYYEQCMGEDISPLEMPPHLESGSENFSLQGGLLHVIDWQTPEAVVSLSNLWQSTAYALIFKMTHEVLRQPLRWGPVLKEYLEYNPFTLLSVEVPPDAFLEELHPLWQLARGHHHPLERDYTVTHTPYRSFLIFSRANGLLWKWPDPRESFPISLPDGQKIFFQPVCVVAGIKDSVPQWFLEHMRARYPSLPKIRIWQPPENSSD